ncbi:TetR/AcrR family transcriptional regulator [Pseudolysinimonas sp.]|jgi:AcrR family transcriptional regulator|uniref:TetR/AcrR family transcriptional regulator n=1 Tax=Pseudolysinimonas sp. TaxID=2680009 RepID=UPI003783976D
MSTRRDAVENRAALLTAARVVLNRDPDASLEAIAAEAGLSRRSVYGHFPTRDHLLREVTALGAARITEALVGTADDDPVVELALIAARLWSEVDSIQVMAVFAVRGSLRGNIAEALAPLRAMVLFAVDRGQAAGSIRTDIDAHRLARLVEDSLLSVFDESTRSALSAAEGNRLVMLSVLGTLGLDWRSAGRLIDSTKALQ